MIPPYYTERRSMHDLVLTLSAAFTSAPLSRSNPSDTTQLFIAARCKAVSSACANGTHHQTCTHKNNH